MSEQNVETMHVRMCFSCPFLVEIVSSFEDLIFVFSA
jgi:hypothetical protein